MLIRLTPHRAGFRAVYRARVLCGVAAVMLLTGHDLQAQMFGPRKLGGSIGRQPKPGIATAIGNLGNQRFIRGRRSSRDFVGADRAEAREFVGMQQSGAAGSVRSAVTGLGAIGGQSYQVNQPVQRAPVGKPYLPRLAIGFDYAGQPTDEVAEQVTHQLTTTLTSGIAVSMEDRTAILRGVVASEEDRQLAEILASLEPGVSSVQNDLAVAGDKEAFPPPPARPTPPLQD